MTIMKIIIIHGTWARTSKWTKKSLLVESLKENFGEGTIVMHQWSGSNSVSARHLGMKNLINTLGDYTNNVFLIGHSHGGNIAINTLQYSSIKIKGIVTLNTPFFYILNRDFRWIIRWMLLLIGVLGILLSFLLFLFNLSGEELNNFKSVFSDPISLLLIMIFGVSAFFIIRSKAIINKFSSNMAERNQHRIDMIAPKRVQEVPLLCVSTGDDEVFESLQLMDNIANIPSLILGKWLFRIVGLTVGLLVFIFTRNYLMPLAIEEKTLLIVIISVFATPFAIYSIYAIILLISTMFSFFIRGWTQGNFKISWLHLYKRIIITLVPMDYINAKFLQILPQRTKNYSLTHSLLYNDPKAVEKIIDWIKDIKSRKHSKHIKDTN